MPPNITTRRKKMLPYSGPGLFIRESFEMDTSRRTLQFGRQDSGVLLTKVQTLRRSWRAAKTLVNPINYIALCLNLKRKPVSFFCVFDEGSKEATKNWQKEVPPRKTIKVENQLKSPSSPLEGGVFSSPIILMTQNVDHKGADISEKTIILPPSSFSSSDYWLHVRLYYMGKLVTEVTTQTAEGCRIIPLPSSEQEYNLSSPHPLEDIPLPPPQKLSGILSLEKQMVVNKLLLHLDKGVLLWVAPEGVFIKRQCQVRVYWCGPLAPNNDQPNKLEREKTCKVLDTERFLHELEMYLMNKGPEPQYQIQLCFGEEYPESTLSSRKLITANVEPVFARELLINAKTKLRKNAPAI
ncbi:interferon regulatory factor 6-like isoform X2 [Bufo gargarizans]|uniref:interferon regulatory factor 6-like isoform X2 n=1 Tax=Bufo gargarizans TaxID=30331 RepID=UPI001CF55F68|nr:interferon regulatory factor 6-like isoform X2 [Bufo gargarizans]